MRHGEERHESASVAAAAGPAGVAKTDAKLWRHEPVDNWIHTAVDVRKQANDELKTQLTVPVLV